MRHLRASFRLLRSPLFQWSWRPSREPSTLRSNGERFRTLLVPQGQVCWGVSRFRSPAGPATCWPRSAHLVALQSTFGTLARPPSWAVMPVTFAHTLRLFAILALLIGGGASHNMAMAGGVMEAGQASHGHYHNVGSEVARGTCKGALCEQSSPCCLMGHCLVGVMSQEGKGSVAAYRPELNAARISLLAGRLLSAPYRPPTAV